MSQMKAQLRPGPVLRVRVLVGKGTKSTAVLRGCKGAEKQGCQKNCSLQTCSSLLWHWALSCGSAKEMARPRNGVRVGKERLTAGSGVALQRGHPERCRFLSSAYVFLVAASLKLSFNWISVVIFSGLLRIPSDNVTAPAPVPASIRGFRFLRGKVKSQLFLFL